MTANDWWKTLSLFLWFYCTSAIGLVILYFYGICRLSERRFGGRTYAGLLVLFFLLIGGSTFVHSMADSVVADFILLAIWPAIAGLLLLVVVYRSYRLMMGR